MRDGPDVFARLAGALAARVPKTWPEVPDLVAAAVLVPLVVRPGGVHLIFTERSKRMRTHSGQISFPGGKAEPGEDDVTTATREAHEEIALCPSRVEVLGRLDQVLTPTGFRITPVVGRVDISEELGPASPEVEQVFEVSLAALRDPAVFHHEGTFPAFGRLVDVHAYRVGPWRIWGATARMLKELLALSA